MRPAISSSRLRTSRRFVDGKAYLAALESLEKEAPQEVYWKTLHSVYSSRNWMGRQPSRHWNSTRYRSAMARAPCSQTCRSGFPRENLFRCWAEWVRQEHGAAPAGRAGDSATRTHPAPWKPVTGPGIDRGVVFQTTRSFPG